MVSILSAIDFASLLRVCRRLAGVSRMPPQELKARKRDGMAKTGAKRREGVRRYPKSGTIVRADRGERPDQIMAVALAQPHRRDQKEPGHQRAGFSCGRMWLGGMIDDRQYEASEVFTRRAVRYMRTITGTLPKFPSVAAEMVATSTGPGHEADHETIAKIRSEYGELQDALADAGMLFEANSILMRVCVMDWSLRKQEDVGAFRCALNVIANRLRIG